MAYSTITKPSLYFNTKLYTGNGSDNHAITGVGFQPDWLWIKKRNGSTNHNLFDVVRGNSKGIQSNSNGAEYTSTETQKTFDSDGFTLGVNGQVNGNSDTFVGWNWKANGQGSSNTDGSINTTYTSVNTTAGFSIVSFTGTGSNATVGHGLGVAPKVIITKSRANNENWGFYHESTGNEKQLVLNNDGSLTGASSAYYNNTSPTSTVFSVGTADSTNDAANMVAYCFAEKKGYSKFGTYKGNGNTEGSFIYTGFKPAFILLKDSSSVVSWTIYDDQRSSSGNNPTDKIFHPNNSNAENTADNIDIVSNGFKCRTSVAGTNKNNATFIYMAFAAEPLVANVGQSIPATAR